MGGGSELSVEEQLAYIETNLAFLLDGPFMETAKEFPSPEHLIRQWYLLARIFTTIKQAQGIPDEQDEILDLFVEDAIAEFRAAEMLNEPPDTDEVLGVGYEDDYDIPENFAEMHQAVIWDTVISILKDEPEDLGFTLVDKDE